MEQIITSFDGLKVDKKGVLSIEDFELIKVIGTGSYGKVILT